MDSIHVAVLLLYLLSFQMNARAQTSPTATCDVVNNVCVNGVCEMQSNQQMGCTCNSGYMKDPSNPLVCNPVPACNLLPGAPDQQCLNGWCQFQMNGAFGCSCFPGYQTSASNPNICENVNECLLPNTGCAPSSCTDWLGDYSCTACLPGYTLNRYGKCSNYVPNYNNNNNKIQNNPFVWAWLYDNFFF